MAGSGRCGFELAAQLSEVDAEVAGLLGVSGPPDLAEKVLAIDVVYADDRRQVRAGIALVPEAPPLTALLEVLERQWQSR